MALCAGSLNAQYLYSEDFENETPTDASNLCHAGTAYVPADGNWSLGPACMIMTNGIPQLIDDGGDTHLLFNNEYSAGDEVFQSATMDISGLSTVRISFDARSQGDVENSGGYIDQFEMFVVVDGTKTSIYQADVRGRNQWGRKQCPGDLQLLRRSGCVWIFDVPQSRGEFRVQVLKSNTELTTSPFARTMETENTPHVTTRSLSINRWQTRSWSAWKICRRRAMRR